MRRVFVIDVLACAACGGRLPFIATIEDPPVVAKILAYLGLPTAGPALRRRGHHQNPPGSTSPDFLPGLSFSAAPRGLAALRPNVLSGACQRCPAPWRRHAGAAVFTCGKQQFKPTSDLAIMSPRMRRRHGKNAAKDSYQPRCRRKARRRAVRYLVGPLAISTNLDHLRQSTAADGCDRLPTLPRRGALRGCPTRASPRRRAAAARGRQAHRGSRRMGRPPRRASGRCRD